MEEHRFEWMSIEGNNYQHSTKGTQCFAWITAGRAARERSARTPTHTPSRRTLRGDSTQRWGRQHRLASTRSFARTHERNETISRVGESLIHTPQPPI